MTGTQIVTAVTEEAGDASSILVNAEVWRWFSEGASRLRRYLEKSSTLTWTATTKVLALPTDFVSVDRLDYDTGVTPQGWRVFGRNLIIDRPTGASAAGTARLYYWAERPEITAGADVSVGTRAEDYACIYYALHRFYRKLSSNRVQFKRYATLLGANAVSMGDLQAESDRLYQDFVDTRDDQPPLQPTSFYGG